MYEIMIIDDDSHVRERLKSIIHWSTLDATLSCEAADSETAKELYMLYHPKIIITDISIPIISGLDLAKQLRQEDPELQFIIITGYNDFNMVRQSVDLNAVSLLGKPVNPDDINSSIEKAIHQLESMRQKNASTAALQHIISNNLPQLQEAYVISLLRKEPPAPTLVDEKIRQLEIPLHGPHYTSALISVRTSPQDSENKETIILLLRDILCSLLPESENSLYSFVNSENRLVCIFNTTNPAPDDLIENILLKASEQLLSARDSRIFAGIGRTVSHAADLYRSYAGALSALKYQALLGNEHITLYRNLEPLGLNSPTPVFDHLKKQFRLGNMDAISDFVQHHCSKIVNYPESNKKDSIRNFVFEYVTLITNEAIHAGIKIEETKNCASLIARLFQTTTPEILVQDALQLTQQLIGQIHMQSESSNNHLIRMAKSYIDANLNDEMLNLEQVSNHIGLSRIYFCKLFHQIEGVSFSAYLKQARIEAAKKLLLTTNLKVFEISDATGFSNPKYFSYVFKQETGLTPGEFQKKGH